LKKLHNQKKINSRWLFKMAWRDAKASKSRLLLFMASIVLGIAAVVSIQLFSQNLTSNIQRQSKSLMGADFRIDLNEVPSQRAQFIIDSLQPNASEINFVSMVAFPKNNNTKLVRIRGLQGDFPFYGKLETQPKNAAKEYQSKGGALVDATLMLQFNIKAGDSIKVGEITLPIAGSLNAIPGNTAVSSSVAPLVIIPYRYVEETQLIQFGSRKRYEYYYYQPEVDLTTLEAAIQPMLEAENADLDTHISTSSRLGRRYDNVGSFLNLTAFIALLLGCVGIASSVNIYIKEKIKSIAVLKCLGASKRQSFLIYLIQIAGIGILGGIIGTAIGVGLQEIFPLVLKEFLPFDITISVTLQPLIMGVVLGLVMSVLFALLPLLRTWYVSPLEVLRITENATNQSIKAKYVAIGIIALFLYAFSYWILRDSVFALAFIGGILVTFGILSGIAIGLMKIVKNYFPKGAGFTTRQSLLNLFRPNNQTVVLLVAIGLGTFLISTLYFTKDILLDKTALESSTTSANLIALDVQPNQVGEVINTFKENDLQVLDNIPLVTMRMHRINNKLVNNLRTDTTSQIKGWVLSHEFRTTYRNNLIDSEEIIAGQWVGEHNQSDIISVSISENLAEDARVALGDSIVFNVQGVLMPTRISSIRKVDWANLQPNFTVLFPSGILESAPQFFVLTTHAATQNSSAKLQRSLVQKFPNISVIDLRQMYTVVEDILNKVSWIINFMAFFSIITGIIVLIGSVRTSKYQRIKESVLLRTLGAKNKQILTITALEYLFLGILGSLLGIVLALISSLLLAVFVFEEPFTPSVAPFIIFLPGISLLVLAIGLSNIRTVLRSSPLEVLRKTR
tara:strand:+ start:52160 stop:54703 length:2544 start_codon:yes stop_codon:yes gene_type:complete